MNCNRLFALRKIENDYEKQTIMFACNAAFPNTEYIRVYDQKLISKICKYAEFISAFEKEKPCGYIAVYANDYATHRAYITMIATLPVYQNRGIGQALLDAGMEVSRKNGMKFIRLEVRRSNHIAIQLYEKNGFIFEKERDKNSIYMTRIL